MISYRKRFRQVIGLILLGILTNIVKAQTDHEFWFAAPEITNEVMFPPSFDTTNIDRPIVLIVSTADGPAHISIRQPANPSFPTLTYTILTDQFFQIDLTPYIDLLECRPANTVLNKGLYMTSDKLINVQYEIQNTINSETYTLKGKNALGTEFLIPAQSLYPNYASCNPPARNSIAIVATEDNTHISIIPSKQMEGQPGLDTIHVNLNYGQTWCGRAALPDGSQHLGGTFVFADKPIGITVTDDAVRPDNANGHSIDIAGDQLIPREYSGIEYISMHLSNGVPIYLSELYVYAYYDSTTVAIDGINFGVINRGEVKEVSSPNGLYSYIVCNHPVEVFQFLYLKQTSSEVAGQVVPTLQCSGSRRVTISRTGPLSTWNTFWVNLVTRVENSANFLCSDPLIQSHLIPSNFYLIPSTGNTWGFYGFGYATTQNITYTFTNTSGPFQASTINELMPGAMRNAYYTSASSLNLGSNRVLCPGDTILLDAGYGKSSYLWSTGDTSEKISVTTPGTYWVTTTDPGCTLSDTIVISGLNFTHINLGPDKNICPGDSLRLDAGTGKSWYHWSTGDTTQSIVVHDSGTYWVTVPVSPCTFTDSDTIHISKLTSIDLGPDRSMCPGDSVLLNAGSGMTGYIWNTGAMTQTIEAKDSGEYSVTATYQNCIFSDAVRISFLPRPLVSLGPDTSVCTGQSFNFDAGYCIGCSYEWDNLSTHQLNIGNNQTYMAGQAGLYRATVTGLNGCKNSDTVQLSVHNSLQVSISINVSGNNLCQGIPVNFNATTQNGGSLPLFQWKINGSPTGTNDSVFTYLPSNSDTITCSLLSSESVCISNNPAVSNKIIMQVTDTVDAGVTIAPSMNPVCAGIPVTFTAIAVHGGSAPFYQWKVNGINAGTNNPIFSYLPANGDDVRCVLVSNAPCITNNPTQSNQVLMNVTNNLPVSGTISASANPFCPGSPVIFTASPINIGLNPLFQWKVNGNNAGTNSLTYTYSPVTGDQVSCIFLSSLTCVTGNPATSNTLVMSGTLGSVVTFAACFDTVTTTDAQPIRLKGGIPLGGSYTGLGVSMGLFYPAIAGPGTHQVNYTYTNSALCSTSAHLYIHLSNPTNLTCGNQITDLRDGKIYPTVQIGSQCWMAANLNYGNVVSGTIIQRDNCLNEKYCYNNDPSKCSAYGGFYQWDEVMQYDNTQGNQGFCPAGWHIPTENDWQILFNFFNGPALSGSPLIESGFSGFDALVDGSQFENSSWLFFGFATHLWSSSSHGPYKAWAHAMNLVNHSVSNYPSLRSNAIAVRCLKN